MNSLCECEYFLYLYIKYVQIGIIDHIFEAKVTYFHFIDGVEVRSYT